MAVKKVRINLERALVIETRAMAAALGITLDELVDRALREFIDAHKNSPPDVVRRALDDI